MAQKLHPAYEVVERAVTAWAPTPTQAAAQADVIVTALARCGMLSPAGDWTYGFYGVQGHD